MHCRQETAAQRLQALQHGLLSDNDAEWGRQLAALAAYREAHGDAHVGHRPDDEAELVRWAAKQRAASKADDLPLDRHAPSIARMPVVIATHSLRQRWLTNGGTMTSLPVSGDGLHYGRST